MKKIILFLLAVPFIPIFTQSSEINNYNIIWKSPSHNASESMPCGGGDIGLNVWAEEGDVLFYLSQSGAFDESNGFLKLGRVRIRMNPNPFAGNDFCQELVLKDGYVKISGKNIGASGVMEIWADVFRPAVHIEIKCINPVSAEAIYENWRFQDIPLRPGENF